MVDPAIELQRRMQSALSEAFGEIAGITTAEVHRSTYADYQSDSALSLARRLKRSPRDVAAAVVKRLQPDEVLDSATVSGPGFINLTLRSDYLSKALEILSADDRLGSSLVKDSKTVVIDYSSPNLAKEMHVGHLRSTIIGDALARVFEFIGHKVIRQNHIGDWGTPFGMLIEHLLDERTAGRSTSIRQLSAFYRAARLKFDSDSTFAARARRRVVALQSSDASTLALWRGLVAITLEHIQDLYEKLDITLKPEDVTGESHFYLELADVVNELERNGIAQISDGAVCVFPPGFVRRDGAPMPLIVRKQDGGFTYATTDLAALRYRLRSLDAKQILYVVGAPQHQHLAMVFAAGRMAGWADDTVRLDHVEFGSVLGQDRKMLKSRSGDGISLNDLIDEGVEKARRLVDEKSPNLSENERAAIARAIGIGAIKYADLANDRIKDYVFDWNRMLAFDGNTGPYLMYAHSRICSILRKAACWTNAHDAKPVHICLDSPPERALALVLLQFARTIDRTAETLQLNRLAQFLFELASVFTKFYETCPVLRVDEPLRASRLALCELTAHILAKGLGLMGIAAPEQI
jgi:arginyl-tRNA synthetase